MKFTPIFLILAAAAASVCAQEKPAKPERKPLDFGAGAKPLELAAVAPADKPAEKPSSAPAVVPKAPAEIVHTFFGLLEKQEIDAAYTGLTSGSKIAERPEELRGLKTKTREAIAVFGTISGYDLVESRPVGQRLVRATYISLGREFPLRWRFYFYKAEEIWRLIDLRVDDKLTGIFDEPAEAKLVEPQ